MLTYWERIAAMRRQKIEDTKAKKEQYGYLDLDDNGGVAMPKDFLFTPVSNSEDGGFYGPTGFSVNLAKLLDAHPVYVNPTEILAGRRMVMLLDYQGGWPGKWPEHLYPYDHLKANRDKYDLILGIGSNQHYACDFEMGAAMGFGGMLDKICAYREKNGAECHDFYDAHERVLLAIQRFIQRHVDEMSILLETQKDAWAKENLREMIRCNRNIISKPPQTFLEVCQWLGWFYHVSWMYNREGAGMRIDQFLYPYYLRDKAAGILDDEKATFILSNLLLLNANYYQLAGPDENGKDQVNELSFLVLEAADWLNSSANITIRLHENTDDKLFEKAVYYLFKNQNGWPRFSGHKGLMNYTRVRGMTPEMARERIAVGCNWMALPGREYPFNDCVKVNTAKVFEVAYQEVCELENPTTQLLWECFLKHLRIAVDTTAQGVNFHLDHMHRHMPELLGNLMMHGVMESGKDMTLSAEWINIGVDGAGLAIVADSFAALEQRVELEGKLSWQQVKEALQDDFTSPENRRVQLILKNSDRYCKGGGLGDKWAVKINEEFSRMITQTPMPHNRVMIPGWFSWANTIGLGKTVGATPDGRNAHAPLMHGANPNYNFSKDSAATAMSNGIAMVQPGYGNPAPFQLELDPGLTVEEGGVQRVMALLKGHVMQGGTLINVNILDKEKILAAHENPEAYPELVVRVTGFTAYFMMLSKEFRQLVVDRIVESI